MATKEQLEIEGRRLTITNLDKILFSGGRFTKAKVIDYYIRISKFLLPHLKDRPVTLKRFPNGIYREFFYEKDAPSFTPDWVRTFPVPRREGGSPIRYILINDLATMVWLANLANLEIHPFLHRAPLLDRPTWIVFDLDPGEGADVLTCARVAFMLRELLENLKLKSFVKVSGSKGLQVYVPLNTTVTYEQTRPFAKAIAGLLAEREPELIVAKMPKVFRAKKVFIDWSQNDDYKTTVSVYSLRAKTHRPYVSMPVEWDELKRALAKADKDELYFTPEEALAEVEKRSDIFKAVLTTKQKLPANVAALVKRPRTTARREFSSSTDQVIRRSRQGGRRRFIVERHGSRDDLLLEMNRGVRSWAISGGVPTRIKQKRSAASGGDYSPASVSTAAKEMGKNKTRDVGTYDLIEGSFESGLLRVHLLGNKLRGEWTLTRAGNKWDITKTGNVEPARKVRTS